MFIFLTKWSNLELQIFWFSICTFFLHTSFRISFYLYSLLFHAFIFFVLLSAGNKRKIVPTIPRGYVLYWQTFPSSITIFSLFFAFVNLSGIILCYHVGAFICLCIKFVHLPDNSNTGIIEPIKWKLIAHPHRLVDFSDPNLSLSGRSISSDRVLGIYERIVIHLLILSGGLYEMPLLRNYATA